MIYIIFRTTLGGTPCLLRAYLHPIKVIPKPHGTILYKAKGFTILGRTHSLPSYLPISSKHGRLLIKVTPLFTKTKKKQPKMPKQSYIYKNEQRTTEKCQNEAIFKKNKEITAKNTKSELYLQKRRKNNQKWQNKAIIKLHNTNSQSNRDNTTNRQKTVSILTLLPCVKRGKISENNKICEKNKLPSPSSSLC